MGTFMRVFFKFLSVSLRLAAFAVIIAIPLLGVWGLSSLAAFAGADRWMAIGAGVLAFPVLPLVWDLWARRRRSKKLQAAGKEEGNAILTAWDRLVVRTFVLNAVFVVGVVLSGPQTLFTALSTRGDWMLDGHEGAGVETAREVVFATTDSLQWLYDGWQEPNEFAALVDDGHDADQRPDPQPSARRSDANPAADNGTGRGDNGRGDDPDPGQEQQSEPDSGASSTSPSWPEDPRPHPASNVPASANTDLRAASAWIRGQVDDPRERVKALHDFVARRVAYDAVALASGNFPSQDADTVFQTGTGVCAGYANLFSAMAQAAGLEAVVVVGHTRDHDGNLGDSRGHAWNAVRIDGEWYLVDTTWDAGFVSGTTYEANLRTPYLFTPPEVFSVDHEPDDPAWQLREDPLTRAEFLRQPMLGPKFASQGFTAVGIDRLQMETRSDPSFDILNPRGKSMLATYESDSGREGRCTVTGTSRLHVACDVPGDGRYGITLFAADQGAVQHSSVGRVNYVVRGS